MFQREASHRVGPKPMEIHELETYFWGAEPDLIKEDSLLPGRGPDGLRWIPGLLWISGLHMPTLPIPSVSSSYLDPISILCVGVWEADHTCFWCTNLWLKERSSCRAYPTSGPDVDPETMDLIPTVGMMSLGWGSHKRMSFADGKLWTVGARGWTTVGCCINGSQ